MPVTLKVENSRTTNSCLVDYMSYMRKGYPKGLGKGLGKGKGKGKKGKPSKGGYRDQQHRHVAPQLSFDGSKGKSKGKPITFQRKRETLPQWESRQGGCWSPT